MALRVRGFRFLPCMRTLPGSCRHARRPGRDHGPRGDRSLATRAKPHFQMTCAPNPGLPMTHPIRRESRDDDMVGHVAHLEAWEDDGGATGALTPAPAMCRLKGSRPPTLVWLTHPAPANPTFAISTWAEPGRT